MTTCGFGQRDLSESSRRLQFRVVTEDVHLGDAPRTDSRHKLTYSLLRLLLTLPVGSIVVPIGFSV